MSKRIQVMVDDQEMQEIKRAAHRRDMTVSAWVRQSLRAARLEHPSAEAGEKLQVVRAAVKHSFPTADIDQMLAEIERGHGGSIE